MGIFKEFLVILLKNGYCGSILSSFETLTVVVLLDRKKKK